MSEERQKPKKIQYHWQLDVYKLSVEAAMEIYQFSKSFPKEERYERSEHCSFLYWRYLSFIILFAGRSYYRMRCKYLKTDELHV